MFCLNVSLEAGPLCCLKITLTAGISHPRVLGLFMLGQTTRRACLELALITGILDSFMVCANMDLQVVS